MRSICWTKTTSLRSSSKTVSRTTNEQPTQHSASASTHPCYARTDIVWLAICLSRGQPGLQRVRVQLMRRCGAITGTTTTWMTSSYSSSDSKSSRQQVTPLTHSHTQPQVCEQEWSGVEWCGQEWRQTHNCTTAAALPSLSLLRVALCCGGQR